LTRVLLPTLGKPTTATAGTRRVLTRAPVRGPGWRPVRQPARA
jgi:hypothetical protein